jgi:hypothetical protein
MRLRVVLLSVVALILGCSAALALRDTSSAHAVGRSLSVQRVRAQSVVYAESDQVAAKPIGSQKSLELLSAEVAAVRHTPVGRVTFTYDVPAIARVKVHEIGAAEASPAGLSDSQVRSASPSIEGQRTSTTPVAGSAATEAESAIPGLSASEQRAVNSLEQRVAEHQAKLEAYQADPFANDNLGILEHAPSAEIQQSIIDGRIRHLQNEIQAFQDQIDKLLGGRS